MILIVVLYDTIKVAPSSEHAPRNSRRIGTAHAELSTMSQIRQSRTMSKKRSASEKGDARVKIVSRSGGATEFNSKDEKGKQEAQYRALKTVDAKKKSKLADAQVANLMFDVMDKNIGAQELINVEEIIDLTVEICAGLQKHEDPVGVEKLLLKLIQATVKREAAKSKEEKAEKYLDDLFKQWANKLPTDEFMHELSDSEGESDEDTEEKHD